MEKRVLSRNDMERLKMAMVKHEETFKEQVYELHRLYRIQKMLMKDTPKNAPRSSPHYAHGRADSSRPVQEYNSNNVPKSGEKYCTRVHEGDLELTLGPRSYYQKKIKAAEPAFHSESGLSFSSSSTGSSQAKGGVTRSTTTSTTTTRDEFSCKKKLWCPEMEMPVSSNVNQDRLNSSPWLFQALSLNIT